MVLWAMVMAVVLFLLESHLGSRANALWAGVAATALFGAYLGWRRRAAAVFIAPLVSWVFAWPFVWLGSMIHDGFFHGFFGGLFTITFGWLAIGFCELVWLAAVAFLVRLLRGPPDRGEPDVVIFGPGDA